MFNVMGTKQNCLNCTREDGTIASKRGGQHDNMEMKL